MTITERATAGRKETEMISYTTGPKGKREDALECKKEEEALDSNRQGANHLRRANAITVKEQ